MQPRGHHWALAVAVSLLLHAGFAGAFLASWPAGESAGGAPGSRTIGLALPIGDAYPSASESAHEAQPEADDPPPTLTPAEAVKSSPDRTPPETEPAELAESAATVTTSAAPPFKPPPPPAKPERRPPPQPVERARQAATPAPPRTIAATADLPEPARPAGPEDAVRPESAGAEPAGGPASASAAALDGPGPAGLREDDLATLRAWLERHKVYPQNARARRQTGTGTLQFTVERSGRVADYRVTETTGHSLLDRAVVTMIERAKPLPAIPEALQLERLEVMVPVAFALE